MKNNNFLLYSIIIFSFASIFLSSVAVADVVSPKKQLRAQISIEDVICNEGNVNKLAVVQVKGTAGIQTPKQPIIGYDFVFEVCALGQKIFVPEVFVKSDSDAQHIELASSIDANTCQTTSTIVKAANPDSITATLENKGEISQKLSLLESKIADLSQKLEAEKKTFGEQVRIEDSSR